MQLYQKEKTFSLFCFCFFLHFKNIHEILNICQKKMTLIADVYTDILASKYMFR